MRKLTEVLVPLLVALLLLVPSVIATSFPQGPPNDPDYAPAESTAPGTCATVAVNSEQHYLYSFMPRCARNAHDPQNASGMSVDAAWANYTTGDPSVVIAYVEGGINWHDADARDLVNQVWLNTGELPLPEDANGTTHGTYDLNGDGIVNVQDYAHDPRVHDTNGNGYLDPEDLIVLFSDGVDDDHNGFVDDISGWDFYDHQNDPATVDSTYGHANNQMRQAAAEANNGLYGAGVCPGCRILPIKAGAEALDRTDDLAQAWLYADHVGASVVVSVTADLGYSAYMNQTVAKLWRDGVVMVEASNDFDSLDHQGGMFWPHVLPGNGLVSNTQGDPDPATANAALTTFRARSDLTSWGAHNMFSAATDGGSTSESTPTVGGILALVLSEGIQANRTGLIHGALTGPEAIQVVRATASDVRDPSLPWPGRTGWDPQYGYGRPDALAAAAAVAAGDIPPTPSIDGPRWYAVYDPTTRSSVPITGSVAAPRSSNYTWVLQAGLGVDPQPGSWFDVANGSGSAPFHGHLGTLNLSRIPASFWNAPFHLASDKNLSTNDQYTVTLRLRLWDASGRMGEDRRAIAVHHDPSLLPGFPRRMGIGGASQPALADLDGDGHLDIIVGDADGLVHAIDPTTGQELPGWPVTTRRTVPDHPTGGIDPGHEPVLAPVAVGDLLHDGHLEVVATSTSGTVYVFGEHGNPLPGWPKVLDTGTVTPPIPRPALPFTRLPHRGATASPVLVDLTGNGQLDIVQAAWDGRVHAWRPDGSPVPGWPVHVTLPANWTLEPGHVLVNDSKLDTTPAIADLDGDGRPEVVVKSQLSETPGAGIQPDGVAHVFAYHADGTPVAGWPASLPSTIEYYGSAQEFLTEGSSVPAAADVNHDGRDEVAVSPIFSPTYLLGENGSILRVYGPATNPGARVLAGAASPSGTTDGQVPTDVPVSFTTSGAFGDVGGTLVYAQPGSGAASIAASLLVPGSGGAIANYARAYDAASGATRPGYPAILQGLDFLGAPAVADVTGDGVADVVVGGDSAALHAITPLGTEAPGFPKFTTGWVLFSPAVGDLRGDGTNAVVAATREGYLMAWSTPGDASAASWSTYHHDDRRTGRYGTDATPPGALLDPQVQGNALTFRAPGGDWYHGTVAGYRVSFHGTTWTVAAAGPAGTLVHLALPHGVGPLVVQAVDGAGNLGRPLRVAVANAAPQAPSLAPLLVLLGGLVVVRRRKT